jgi:hypothetical protein
MFGGLRARVSLWALAGLAVISLAGCASGRYVIIDAPTVPLKNFSVLEIKDCTSNPQEENALDLAKGFGDQMMQKLVDYNKKNTNAPLFATVTRSTDKADGVLVMQSVLQSYEKGSRAARYIIGFGAGKASCTVQCVFTDKRSGNQILKANFEGELSMGIAGGSAKQAAGKVYDKILEYLKKNY